MRSLRVLSVVLIVVTILALVTGCAPQATPAPEPTPVPATKAPEPTEPPPPPESRALRVTFSWPTYIDPAVGSDFSSTSSLCNLYDTLVFPNTDGGVDPGVGGRGGG